jgi:hypothetical protein
MSPKPDGLHKSAMAGKRGGETSAFNPFVFAMIRLPPAALRPGRQIAIH